MPLYVLGVGPLLALLLALIGLIAMAFVAAGHIFDIVAAALA
jgi:hypothetical protein